MHGFLTILLALCTLLPSCARSQSSNPGLPGYNKNLNFIGSSFGVPGQSTAYDYVIIGGGTAGLTIASRLASHSNTSVAVIEAGGFYETDNGNYSVVPSDAIFFTGASASDTAPLIDWGFVTSPQMGMNNRRMHYARGKTLGGSSARNYFTYQRGTTMSYARWAEAVDDPSYELDSFLPYFQKSVLFTPPNNQLRAKNASLSYNTSAFSNGGPLQVSVPVWSNPFTSFVKRTFESIGVREALDFVSGTLLGVQYSMNTIDPRDQTRSSSESAFLRQALSETKLMVYKNTMAERILFQGKEATGVRVNTAGVTYELSARKEVILSAGAFQSPQLLMLSGVGPSDTLTRFNIPMVADRPGVGQNMWDHILFGPSLQVDVTTHSALTDPVYLAEATEEYLQNGTGIIGNPGGDLIAWEKYPYRSNLSNATQEALARFPDDWPELEHLILDAYSGDHENYETGSPKSKFMYASPMVALIAPLSRGNVSISSTDPNDPPVINPNWLTDHADVELAVAGFKRVREYIDNPAMKGSGAVEVYPGLNNVTTDTQILDFIRQTATTVFHASVTNKMGKGDDPMAVVDTKCRVYGTSRLRVVDASAFPILPPGHPQATVYALAEKIAEDIIGGV